MQNAENVQVTTDDGKTYTAKVIGSDSRTWTVVAPDTAITAGPPSGSITGSTVTFEFTAGTSPECSLDGAAAALCAIVGVYYCWVRKLPRPHADVNDQIRTAVRPPMP